MNPKAIRATRARSNARDYWRNTTFNCPRCGYTQKGYFNQCPARGCEEAKMRERIEPDVTRGKL